MGSPDRGERTGREQTDREQTDAELIAARDEDGDAFAELYRRHADDMLRYFVRRTGDAQTAADLTSETFAQALAASLREAVTALPQGQAEALRAGEAVLDRRRRRSRLLGAVAATALAIAAIGAGLWVLADPRSPVEQVAAGKGSPSSEPREPREQPQEIVPDRTTTSTAATAAPAVSTRAITAVAQGDGTTIGRVEAPDGSVIALRLPETYGHTFQVSAGAGPEVLAEVRGDVDGEAMVARIEIGFCDLQPLRTNALGLAAGPVRWSKPPPSLGFCRPDEFLRLIVDPVPDVEAPLDRFDLVPVALGQRYTDWIDREVGFDRQCCFEDRGPMWFGDVAIVSDGSGSGQVTALDRTTLAPVWTTDLVGLLGGGHDEDRWVGGGSYLYAVTDGGTVVATTGFGYLVGLAADTGDPRWTVDLGGESPGGATTAPGGRIVVAADVETEGGVEAPTIRSIDVGTGEVVWSSAGEPATGLQWTDPVVVGEVVLVADVPTSAERPIAPPPAAVTAYDLTTGERVWRSKLDSTTEAYAPFSTILTDPARDLLLVEDVDGAVYRLDPRSGARLWTARPGFGPFVGLSAATVTVGVRGAELDLDLETGVPAG